MDLAKKSIFLPHPTVVYGIKHGIDNLGNSQAKMDMNLAVSETSKETEAKKWKRWGLLID